MVSCRVCSSVHAAIASVAAFRAISAYSVDCRLSATYSASALASLSGEGFAFRSIASLPRDALSPRGSADSARPSRNSNEATNPVSAGTSSSRLRTLRRVAFASPCTSPSTLEASAIPCTTSSHRFDRGSAPNPFVSHWKTVLLVQRDFAHFLPFFETPLPTCFLLGQGRGYGLAPCFGERCSSPTCLGVAAVCPHAAHLAESTSACCSTVCTAASWRSGG